mmetsp:Transcript_11917/g.32919  ORF Transcript_11917/g.32919 Transcript_11917/m.32919 type:complete len:229 (-) Transcript_11917:897-1583(-)
MLRVRDAMIIRTSTTLARPNFVLVSRLGVGGICRCASVTRPRLAFAANRLPSVSLPVSVSAPLPLSACTVARQLLTNISCMLVGHVRLQLPTVASSRPLVKGVGSPCQSASFVGGTCLARRTVAFTGNPLISVSGSVALAAAVPPFSVAHSLARGICGSVVDPAGGRMPRKVISIEVRRTLFLPVRVSTSLMDDLRTCRCPVNSASLPRLGFSLAAIGLRLCAPVCRS